MRIDPKALFIAELAKDLAKLGYSSEIFPGPQLRNPEYEELLDQHVRYGGDSEDPKEALIFCRRKGPNNSKLFVAGHYADGSNYIAFGEGWHDVPPRRGL